MIPTILLAVALGSIVSLVGGLALLGLPERVVRRAEHLFVALAAGALLGAATLDLLPEAIEVAPDTVAFAVLAGVIAFFFLERGLHWFHHGHEGHDEDHGGHAQSSIALVIAGDTVHNLIDGAAIAISFMTSPELGILTAVAVGLHEVPQEVGDFALMLARGFSKTKALVVNALSALSAFLGAGIAYVLAEQVAGVLPWLLGGTAGMFLYISLSNLIPDLHRKHDRGLVWLETVVLVAGVASVGAVGWLVHHLE